MRRSKTGASRPAPSAEAATRARAAGDRVAGDRVAGDRVAAHAPGKIILLGEHAVVYGQPAVGVPLSRGVSVELTRGRGVVSVSPTEPRPPRGRTGPSVSVTALARAALGPVLDDYDLAVTLELPPMAGLGSSAALAVALLRARAAVRSERTSRAGTLAEATRIEDLAHGRSSGVDPAIVLANAPIVFERGRAAPRIRRLEPACPLHIVVGAYGSHGGTARSVGHISDLRAQEPKLFERVVCVLGEATRAGARAIVTGKLEPLGQALDLAHGVLAGLGLVSSTLEQIVRATRDAGALGAKMSGAGGRGGAFVALARDARSANRIRRVVSALGAIAWVETLAPVRRVPRST